jgi:hypothetical protein
VLSGEGRIIVQRDEDRAVKVLVYVPIDVARDSQFPFQDSGPVNVRVDSKDGTLIVGESNPD